MGIDPDTLSNQDRIGIACAMLSAYSSGLMLRQVSQIEGEGAIYGEMLSLAQKSEAALTALEARNNA